MHLSSRRAGFMLVWILVTVALLAILAAVVAPSVATVVDRRRALATADVLHQITAGIVRFESVVHKSNGTTNDYPGDVSQLSTVVRPNLDNDSCGLAMTARDSTDWIANGPFVSMYIPIGGLWTPIGRIADDIPTRTQFGDVYVLIPGVTAADVASLTDVVDHGSGDTVTSLHAVINDTTTVQYRALSAAQAPNKC